MLLILLIYHYVFKKILTNHFYFVAFKCRKANTGDDDVKSGERWTIIAWAMLERPVIVRDKGGGDYKVKEEVEDFQSFYFKKNY
jgi:hypothetical protein